MKVFIQDLRNARFMNAVSQWGSKKEAYDFRTLAFAIDLCLKRRLRNVRVIVDLGNPAEDVILDVRGNGLRDLCEGVKENRRLRERQQVLKAELDAVRAAQKEQRKRFPFVRRHFGSDEPTGG